MHKKMSKNVARKMAIDVMYSQGMDVLAVADVLRRLEKQKSIRLYTKNIVKSMCWNCDKEIGKREVVDGCLVAWKNESGKIQFGMSAIHPKDLDVAPSKQVTGMIAAVKAELSPCEVIPSKFEEDMTGGGFDCSVPTRFVSRCFKYFRVNEISFKISFGGTHTCLYVYKRSISALDIYLAQMDAHKFPDPNVTIKKITKVEKIVDAKKAAKITKKVNDTPCSCGMCESFNIENTAKALKKAESEVTKFIDSKLKNALVNVEKTSENKVVK